MLNSEKRSLIRFLAIYLISTLLLFSLASWIFYLSAKKSIIQQQREAMKYEAEHIQSKLIALHRSNSKTLVYPSSTILRSAIYDYDKQYIYGTLPSSHSLDSLGEMENLHYISKIEPYYLGAAYLLIEKKKDFSSVKILEKRILLFMLAAGIFFSILGYFLGRLFMTPMRDSIEKLNHFIQDTTHELNTPISTILTNIELIETFGDSENNNNELKRIEIASKTLSRIYDDLTYLNLNHQYHRKTVEIDMSKLLRERVVYFSVMAESKELKIFENIDAGVICIIDKNDAIRLIDNLISNAIKYNKPKGSIKIVLTSELLKISDTGLGIKQKDLNSVTNRFKRVNKSEGGFGIGLNIVKQVVDYYDYNLKINSEFNKGTMVIVEWKK